MTIPSASGAIAPMICSTVPAGTPAAARLSGEVPGNQIEMVGGDAAALVNLPHRRAGVRLGAAKGGPEELHLPALQPCHVGPGKETGQLLIGENPRIQKPRRRFPAPLSRRSARRCSTCLPFHSLSLGCAIHRAAVRDYIAPVNTLVSGCPGCPGAGGGFLVLDPRWRTFGGLG